MKPAKRGSSGGAKPRTARKGPLSAEDEALWQLTSATLDPLRKTKPRVPAPVRSGEDNPARTSPAPAPKRETGPDRHPPWSAAPARLPAAAPPLAAFDKKRARRIAAGQIAIDARLDLHGARQSEAHRRLRAFLVDCAAEGCSTVLVVTGKGGRRDAPAGPLANPYAEPERGILRRQVPLWLEEPDMRALVAGYAAAGIKHGGEGALYIHLRRRVVRGT